MWPVWHGSPPTVPTAAAMVWAAAGLPRTQSCAWVSLLPVLPFPSCSLPGSHKGVLKMQIFSCPCSAGSAPLPGCLPEAVTALCRASKRCLLAALLAALVTSCVPHTRPPAVPGRPLLLAARTFSEACPVPTVVLPPFQDLKSIFSLFRPSSALTLCAKSLLKTPNRDNHPSL